MAVLTDDTGPADKLARVLAHIGHRLPLVNRIEKRLEGQDKTAGLGSDLAALTVDLFKRNEEVIVKTASSIIDQKRAAKEAATVATPATPGTAPVPPQQQSEGAA